MEVLSGLDLESGGRYNLVLRNCLHNLNIKKGVNMLPDFLKTKEKLKKMHNTEMKKAQFRHLGPFADTPKSEIFEGDEVILTRSDGSREEVKVKKAEGKMEIKLKEIEEMTHERILDKINTVAREMAKQIAKEGYETLSQAAEGVGNVTSADGKPLSIDLLLEGLEKMHLSFDEDGQPSGLRLVAHPKMSSALEKICSQLESHPRYQELMERKREEERVRENSRELVG